MIKTALRSFAAVIAGLLVSFLVVMAVELFGAVVHPVPEGFKGTKEEMCRHVKRYPRWVLTAVVPAWAGAVFIGTWTARRIGNIYSAAVVGVLLLVALLFNLAMLPYPMWFKIANPVVIAIAIVTGSRASARRKTADAGEAG